MGGQTESQEIVSATSEAFGAHGSMSISSACKSAEELYQDAVRAGLGHLAAVDTVTIYQWAFTGVTDKYGGITGSSERIVCSPGIAPLCAPGRCADANEHAFCQRCVGE